MSETQRDKGTSKQPSFGYGLTRPLYNSTDLTAGQGYRYAEVQTELDTKSSRRPLEPVKRELEEYNRS